MSILNFIFNKKKHRRPQYPYSKLYLSQLDVTKIQEEWSRIEELVKLGQPSQLRQAVIKADNLLDFALQRLTTGTTVGERLKNACPYFKDYLVYQGLWEAHKVRNALVHDAEYEPMHTVTKEAIAKVKRGLEVLGCGRTNYRTIDEPTLRVDRAFPWRG